MTSSNASRAITRKTAARKAPAKPSSTAVAVAVATKAAPPPKPVTPDLFREALGKVLLHEGGRVDNPHDPGGRTNKGITQTVYSAWRQNQSLPVRDVFLIDDIEVEAIYRFQYWQPIHGDALPRGVGYVVFDGAVNSGVKQSIKWLQRGLGALYKSTVDGDIGNVTLQAVAAAPDNDKLIAAICQRRLIFLQALKTWPYFRKGWSARVQDVMATGQAWATGSIAPPSEFRPGGEKKADIEDAKSAPPRAPGDLSAGGGSTAVVGAGFLEKAKDTLEPYAASFHWISVVVVWLIVLGLVVGAAGFAWRWWAAKQKAKLDDALDAAS